MIALARQAVKAAAVEARVHPRCARLPMLPLPLQSFDALVSNSLVHHMPDPHLFWNELVRLGKPGAVVLVMDLFRPESPERAREIVEQYSGNEAPVLKEDFFNSLCAAFTLREIREIPMGLQHVSCHIVLVGDDGKPARERLEKDEAEPLA